jgi:hypothetical protein
MSCAFLTSEHQNKFHGGPFGSRVSSITARNSQKNSARFAVISAFDHARIQDFCGERAIAGCKFPGRTAKNSQKRDPFQTAVRQFGISKCLSMSVLGKLAQLPCVPAPETLPGFPEARRTMPKGRRRRWVDPHLGEFDPVSGEGVAGSGSVAGG